VCDLPRRRSPPASDPWTFGRLLTDCEDRHGVQVSTMRGGPGRNDLPQALDGVLAGR